MLSSPKKKIKVFTHTSGPLNGILVLWRLSSLQKKIFTLNSVTSNGNRRPLTAMWSLPTSSRTPTSAHTSPHLSPPQHISHISPHTPNTPPHVSPHYPHLPHIPTHFPTPPPHFPTPTHTSHISLTSSHTSPHIFPHFPTLSPHCPTNFTPQLTFSHLHPHFLTPPTPFLHFSPHFPSLPHYSPP